MSKLLSTLLAGAAALALSGAAFAADEQSQSSDQTQANQPADQGAGPAGSSSPDQAGADSSATDQSTGGQAQSTDPSQQPQTGNQAEQAGADNANTGRSPDQPGGQASAEEQEFLAEMEKCNALADSEKDACVDAAKKKWNKM